MKFVELGETKITLAELCQEAAVTGESCIVTHQGKPLARLEPVREASASRVSIWTKRERHIKEHGTIEPDFELPPPLPAREYDPLA